MIASPSHTLPVILSTHSLCLLSSQSGQWAPIWMNVFVLKSKKTYGMLIFEACQKLSGNSFWMCSVFLGVFLMLDQLMILLVFITSYISPLCREQPVFLRALLSVTRQTVARATGGAWWERARRFQLVTGPCPSLLSLQVPRRAMLSTY